MINLSINNDIAIFIYFIHIIKSVINILYYIGIIYITLNLFRL